MIYDLVENNKYSEKISIAWDQLVNNGEVELPIREHIKDSWDRCIKFNNYNFCSDKPTDIIIRGSKLKDIKAKNSKLIYYSIPKMKELYSFVKGSGYNIVLADNEGYILKVLSDKNLNFSEKYDIVEGANWSEEFQGTNAVGTVIKQKEPVTVYYKEHLLKKNHELVCIATPIIDKFNEIYGVLCMSSNYQNIYPHTTALLKKVCEDINNKLLMHENDSSSNKNYFNNLNKNQKETAYYHFHNIITKNIEMKELIKLAKRVAFNDSTVLLQGETGTGKELLAQSIHNYSRRSEAPFLAINCSAIPDNLFESEFFGYEEGSFTGSKKGGRKGKFEYANKGTIFLDEINNLNKVDQARLLRVLEERRITRLGSNESKKIDVRLISASNQSLRKLVNENKFREDLFYRINVVTLKIPPLREREIDILVIANYFLRKIGYKFNKSSLKVSKEAKKILLEYDWPGNVRELKNIIECSINMMEDSILKSKHLPDFIKSIDKESKDTLPTYDEFEKEFIETTFEYFNGNITMTAKHLNVARNTLYRKLEKYNIKNC